MSDLRKSDLVEQVLALTGAPAEKEQVARQNLSRKSAKDLAVLHSRLSAANKRGAARLKLTPSGEAAHREALALRQKAFAQLRQISDDVRAAKSTASIHEVEAEPERDLFLNWFEDRWLVDPHASILEQGAARAELAGVMESVLVLWMAHQEDGVWRRELPRLMEQHHFRSQFDTYCRRALTVMGRDTLRLMQTQLPDRHRQGLASVSVRMANTLLGDPYLASPLEPVILAKNDNRLNPARAVEALAKIQHYAAGFDADVIVFSDSGSEIVGRFLISQLSAKTGRHAALMTEAAARNVAAGRILVVADVVDEPQSLWLVKDGLQKASHGAEVRVAALAGTSEASQSFGDGDAAYFTHVTIEGVAELPWARTGIYRSTKVRHLFGAGSEAELPVDKAFFDRVSQDFDVT